MDQLTRNALKVFCRGRLFGAAPLALLAEEDQAAVAKAEAKARAAAPPLLDTALVARKAEARELDRSTALLDTAHRRHALNDAIARKAEIQLSIRGIDFGAGDPIESQDWEDGIGGTEGSVSSGGVARRPIHSDARTLSRPDSPLTSGEAMAAAHAKKSEGPALLDTGPSQLAAQHGRVDVRKGEMVSGVVSAGLSDEQWAADMARQEHWLRYLKGASKP